MLKRLRSLLGIGDAAAQPAVPAANQAVREQDGAIIAQVACDRCGEIIAVRLRKSSDIQRNDEGGGYTFFVQKTVVGTRCFNRIDLRLEFDQRYRVTAADVRGGKLAEA